MPKFAIERFLPAISIKASEILGHLTDGKNIENLVNLKEVFLNDIEL